jgi:Kef-type K+ transport system membrane component KefB
MATSRLGTLALTCAAIGDGLAWLALTVILATTGRTSLGSVAASVGATLVLILGTLLVLRPALSVMLGRLGAGWHGIQLSASLLAAGAIGFAALTQSLGLHPVIGALLFGVIVPRDNKAAEQINTRLQGYTMTILLPLFFAGVGLNVSVGLLGSFPGHWLAFAAVLLVAIGAKFTGASCGARLAGMPTGESLRLGALLNCRGVTEIVVATIGLQNQLISPLGFTILVLMAVITTTATGPLIRMIDAYGGRRQGRAIRQSGPVGYADMASAASVAHTGAEPARGEAMRDPPVG